LSFPPGQPVVQLYVLPGISGRFVETSAISASNQRSQLPGEPWPTVSLAATPPSRGPRMQGRLEDILDEPLQILVDDEAGSELQRPR
jgi:hypothetical protein